MSQTQLSLGSSGVPETFVIDGKGVIRYQHLGEIRASDVPLLLAHLREAGARSLLLLIALLDFAAPTRRAGLAPPRACTPIASSTTPSRRPRRRR